MEVLKSDSVVSKLEESDEKKKTKLQDLPDEVLSRIFFFACESGVIDGFPRAISETIFSRTYCALRQTSKRFARIVPTVKFQKSRIERFVKGDVKFVDDVDAEIAKIPKTAGDDSSSSSEDEDTVIPLSTILYCLRLGDMISPNAYFLQQKKREN